MHGVVEESKEEFKGDPRSLSVKGSGISRSIGKDEAMQNDRLRERERIR